MLSLKCSEIIKATGGTLISGKAYTEFRNISTDSRKISAGDLFIPIIGEKFDGHDFVSSSLESGASGSLTQKDINPAGDKVIIKVQDTLRALQDIARYYRAKFNIPFVGITGSVGKTSTKEMVASVLDQKYNVLKTSGNLNNEIGLPLTIFSLDSQHEVGVVEMGMSGFGEISRLTSVAKPDIAIITNIGLSHIEKLGSRQNILKAKMEILEGLHKDGLVVLNGDDNLLHGMKGLLKFRTVFYGMEEGLDYQAYNVKTLGENGTDFEITLGSHDYKVHVPVPGIHNVYNALAAIAAGLELGVPMNRIVDGIAEFSPGKMRLNILQQNGIKIINDAYNASPQSMEAAIDVLKDISGNGRTIAVLGDMLELGDWAEKAHKDVGEYAVSKAIDYIVTVGKMGGIIAESAVKAGADPAKVVSFNTNNDVIDFLKSFVCRGDVVLIKGSRGMKMEQIAEGLTIKL